MSRPFYSDAKKVTFIRAVIHPAIVGTAWVVGRVYATVGRLSVSPLIRLSACFFRPPHAAAASLLLWARRPGEKFLLIACCTAGGPGVRRPNAGSATLSAGVGSWTRACSVWYIAWILTFFTRPFNAMQAMQWKSTKLTDWASGTYSALSTCTAEEVHLASNRASPSCMETNSMSVAWWRENNALQLMQ